MPLQRHVPPCPINRRPGSPGPKLALAALCGLLLACVYIPSNLCAAELLEYVRTALTHQVDIDRTRLNIDDAQGALLEASGTFDTSIEAKAEHGQTDTPTPGPQEPQTAYTSQYTLGLKKELRSGLTLTPQVQTTRRDDGNTQTQTVSSSGAYLIATLPLLRGLGAEANAGLERAEIGRAHV